MTNELLVCGASLPDGICCGAEPPVEWKKAVDDLFVGPLPEGGYRVLPAIEHEGEDEEIDHRDDGTYRKMPDPPLPLGKYVVRGAVICDACYVTLTMLSPSGRGVKHELAATIARARTMEPTELPRIG